MNCEIMLNNYLKEDEANLKACRAIFSIIISFSICFLFYLFYFTFQKRKEHKSSFTKIMLVLLYCGTFCQIFQCFTLLLASSSSREYTAEMNN